MKGISGMKKGNIYYKQNDSVSAIYSSDLVDNTTHKLLNIVMNELSFPLNWNFVILKIPSCGFNINILDPKYIWFHRRKDFHWYMRIAWCGNNNEIREFHLMKDCNYKITVNSIDDSKNNGSKYVEIIIEEKGEREYEFAKVL